MQAGFIRAAPAVVDGAVLQGNGLCFKCIRQTRKHLFADPDRIGALVIRRVEHEKLWPGKARRLILQKPLCQLAQLVRIGLLPAQMQDPSLNMLVIKRARPLDERLAGKRAACLICRKNQLPRGLLRIKLPCPVDDHAAIAAGQTVRMLPKRPQQAANRLIRAVFIQRGGKKQAAARRLFDSLRRKLLHAEPGQRLRQQALQPHTMADAHQRQFLFHVSIRTPPMRYASFVILPEARGRSSPG